MNVESRNVDLALFLPSMVGGGAERVVLNLLKGIPENSLNVDLVLASKKGPYLSQVPSWVNIIDLGTGRIIKSILPMLKYLKSVKPDAIISHISHVNVVTCMAHKLAGSESFLGIVEHNTLSVKKNLNAKENVVKFLMRRAYLRANSIIGVSKAVTDDLQDHLSLPKEKMKTIYNPVVSENLIEKSKEDPNHKFTGGDHKVVIAVGRLTEQKNFPLLLNSFKIVNNKQANSRLVILGEGEDRQKLEALVSELMLEDVVDMPGFVDNPYAFLGSSNCFALSSSWEGLPTVLIEAMASGCPVVATDCPSGPMEILEGGKFGRLVEMDNPQELAEAILQTLEEKVDTEKLIERSTDFSIAKSVETYCKLIGKE